jgi:hypothetical protein
MGRYKHIQIENLVNHSVPVDESKADAFLLPVRLMRETSIHTWLGFIVWSWTNAVSQDRRPFDVLQGLWQG